MATTTQSVNPDTTEIAIGGYSPVSYFENGRAEVGSPNHAVTHDGKTYHLASAEQAETFRANPQKYVPAYGGWCAYGTSVGEKFPVDPENFKIVDGRLMLFLKNDEVDARKLWEKEGDQQCLAKADHACEATTVGTSCATTSADDACGCA